MKKEEFIEIGNIIIEERNRIDIVSNKLTESGLFSVDFDCPILNTIAIERLINYLDKKIGYEWFSYWIYECNCKEANVSFDEKDYVLTNLSELWDFSQLGKDNV